MSWLTRAIARLPPGMRKRTIETEKWLDVETDELERVEDAVAEVKRSRFIDDATVGMLDRWGELIDTPRLPAEADNDYRIRLKAALVVLRSGGTRDDILGFVASVSGNAVEDLLIVENEDVETNAPRTRYYYVEIPTAGLEAQGYTTQAQILAVFDLIEDVLDRVDAAGVQGVVKTGSSFSYEGDGGDLGPTGSADDSTGYWNDGVLYPEFGPTNEGGLWGGFTI